MSAQESQLVPQTEDVSAFAQRVRAKAGGAYSDVPDDQLVSRFVRKNPVYASRVQLPSDFKLLTTSSGYPKLDSLYEQAGRANNVDPNLLLEQARQETINFKPDVVYGRQDSPVGAKGAGQFMPDTARQYGLKVGDGVDERSDPVKSIDAHARMMRDLLDKHQGDVTAALAAYNSGSNLSTASALRNAQAIPETRGYVSKIRAAYDNLPDPQIQTTSPAAPVNQVQSPQPPRPTKAGVAPPNAQAAPQTTQPSQSQLQPDIPQNRERDSNAPPPVSQFPTGLTRGRVISRPPNTETIRRRTLAQTSALSTQLQSALAQQGATASAEGRTAYGTTTSGAVSSGPLAGAMVRGEATVRPQDNADLDIGGAAFSQAIEAERKPPQPDPTTIANEQHVASSLTDADRQEVQRRAKELASSSWLTRAAIAPALTSIAGGGESVVGGAARTLEDLMGMEKIAKLFEGPNGEPINAHPLSDYFSKHAYMTAQTVAEANKIKPMSEAQQWVAMGSDLFGNIALLAAATKIGGLRGGFTGLGYFGARGRGASIPESAKSGLVSAAMAEVYARTDALPLRYRAPAIFGATYQIERAGGASNEQALKAAATNAGLVVSMTGAGRAAELLSLSSSSGAEVPQTTEGGRDEATTPSDSTLIQPPVSEPIDHHSNYQPRDETGQFKEGPAIRPGDRVTVKGGMHDGAEGEVISSDADAIQVKDVRGGTLNVRRDYVVPMETIEPPRSVPIEQTTPPESVIEPPSSMPLSDKISPVPNSKPGLQTGAAEGQEQAESRPVEVTNEQLRNVLTRRGVRGDKLEDKLDLADELRDNGAALNPDGTLTVYHRTSSEEMFQPETSVSLQDTPTKPGEPVAQESTPRPTAEPAEVAPRLTGAANAQTEAERQARGLDPVEKQAYSAVGDSYLKGREDVESGKVDPRTLAMSVDRKPRPLTSSEVGALAHDRARLINEHAETVRQISEAVDRQDETGITEGKVRLQRVESDLDTNDRALQKGGREQSAAFNARKMLVAEDYSFAGVLQRAKAAAGRELTPAERGRFEELTKQLDEANRKLAESEDRNKQLQAEQSVRQMAREVKRQTRAKTKASLDDEFAALKAQFAQAKAEVKSVQPSGLAGLDPEGKLTGLVLKMARNRVEAGVNTVGGLVDEVHAALEDHFPGLTKRDVRDAISGYGRQSSSERTEAQKQLDSLKSQMRRLSASEDVQAGVRSPRREGTPDRVGQAKVRLQKQIDDLQAKIDRGEFNKPLKRETLPLDSEGQRLQAQRERLKARIEGEIKKQELANRGRTEKIADMAVRFFRNIRLSGVTTVGKLTNAVVARIGITPAEEVVGSGLRRLPGISRIAEKAPREGYGFNPRAERAALANTFSRETVREMGRALKTGKTDLDMMYGDKALLQDPEVLAFVGHAHSALKTPAKINEFYRAGVQRTEFVIRQAVRQGLTPEQAGEFVNRPDVKLAIFKGAYDDALRATLMNDNGITSFYNELLGATMRRGPLGKTVGYTLKTLFPVTRTPANLAVEVTSYTAGGPKALGKLLARRGIESLSPEDADYVMRNLKKQAVGGGAAAALTTLAYFGAQQIQLGGFYQQGDNKKTLAVKPGEAKAFGVTIPKWAMHTPLVDYLQMVATIRRVHDEEVKKNGDSPVQSGLWRGAMGIADEIPYYQFISRVPSRIEQWSGARKFAGEEVRDVTVPPDVQRVAKTGLPFTSGLLGDVRDGQPVQRFPRGGVDELLSGIPILRRQVPDTKPSKDDGFTFSRTRQVLQSVGAKKGTRR